MFSEAKVRENLWNVRQIPSEMRICKINYPISILALATLLLVIYK